MCDKSSTVIFPIGLSAPCRSAQGLFIRLCSLGTFHVASHIGLETWYWHCLATSDLPGEFHMAQPKSSIHDSSFWNYAKLCFPFGILAKPFSWWAWITLSYIELSESVTSIQKSTSPISKQLLCLSPHAHTCTPSPTPPRPIPHLLQKQKQKSSMVCGIFWSERCLAVPGCRESLLGQAVLFWELCYFVHISLLLF